MRTTPPVCDDLGRRQLPAVFVLLCKPPIVVRYRSTPGGISLAVDDAGPGIADDAPETAEQSGRLGLLNMAQRAEQIGAILDVKRWPGGGTHVALEWRPR